MQAKVERMGRGDMQPPAGPLGLYRRTFGMHRYVTWEPSRQLWEIRQVSPVSGKDERIELVFHYTLPSEDVEQVRDATGLTRGQAEALLVRSQHPGQRKVYRPFNYELVHERLEQRRLFFRLGTVEYNRRILEQNDARWRSLARHVSSEIASGIGELQRWLPVIGRAQAAKRQGDPRSFAELIEEHKRHRDHIFATS